MSNVPSPPVYPIVGAISDALSVEHDQEYFLDLFDRTFPYGYLFPMKTTPNGGYETFQATAKMGERVSLALWRLENGLLTTFAPVAAFAVGVVAISRPSFVAGAVTVKAGTIVTTSQGGRNFITQSDAVFGATDLGPVSVNITAEASGFEYNLPGPFTSAGGDLVPGPIDSFYILTTDPAYGDISFTVAMVGDTAGGTSQDLEALGFDRGITRNQGEPVQNFRLRVRSLADTVSPGAINRVLTSLLGALHYCFREVGQPSLRGVFFDGNEVTGNVDTFDFFDVDSFAFNGTLTSGVFVDDEKVTLFDASSNIVATGYFGSLEMSNTRFWFIHRDGIEAAAAGYTIVGASSGAIFAPTSFTSTAAALDARRFRLDLDYVEFRAFFLVGLPRLNYGEFGMAYDSGPSNAFDYTNQQTNYFDGFPADAEKLYASVYAALLPIKAGGVGFDLYLQAPGETC